MNDLTNLLFSEVFDFTNKDVDSLNSVVIEECGGFNSELNGYRIVLNRGEIESLRLILQREFPNHKDAIASFIDKGTDEMLTQCVKVCYPNQSLTKKFVDRYGSIENLITYGTTKSLDACDRARLEEKVEEPKVIEEEEDEEMIKELQEELAKANEELAKANDELDYYKSKYPEGDLDDEVLETFVSIMQTESPKIVDSVLNRVVNIANDEEPDELEIKRIIGVILDSLSESGDLESFLE